MDQETLRRLHQILQSLINDGAASVAFMLNQNGRLVAHVGASAAFHPQARFTELHKDEEGENVYMTAIEDRYIIGVVFPEGVSMETMRARAEGIRPTLHQVLAPYLPHT